MAKQLHKGLHILFFRVITASFNLSSSFFQIFQVSEFIILNYFSIRLQKGIVSFGKLFKFFEPVFHCYLI